MRKSTLALILTAWVFFVPGAAGEIGSSDQVAITEGNEIIEPMEPYPPPDPIDWCQWFPEASSCPEQVPCTIGCGTSCFTCVSIPEGPDGEPPSYHCDTNSNGGYTSCTAEADGCTVYGMCGSWE